MLLCTKSLLNSKKLFHYWFFLKFLNKQRKGCFAGSTHIALACNMKEKFTLLAIVGDVIMNFMDKERWNEWRLKWFGKCETLMSRKSKWKISFYEISILHLPHYAFEVHSTDRRLVQQEMKGRWKTCTQSYILLLRNLMSNISMGGNRNVINGWPLIRFHILKRGWVQEGRISSTVLTFLLFEKVDWS